MGKQTYSQSKPQPKPSYPPPKPQQYKASPKPPAYGPPKQAPSKQVYNAPKKPTTYKAPPKPPRPTYKPRPTNPPAPKQTYQKNAPVYVPAPKHFHKPPIIIYQGVAPSVHVYEKSSGGYSPVARAKSGNEVSFADQPKSIKAPVLTERSDNTQEIIVSKDITSNKKQLANKPVAQARSTQVNVAKLNIANSSSAVVGASVSVDEGFEILKRGTVESIDPKAD